MALRPAEYEQPYFKRLMSALVEDGCELTESNLDTFAVFVTIREPGGAAAVP
jgi:hypothetical protein